MELLIAAWIGATFFLFLVAVTDMSRFSLAVGVTALVVGFVVVMAVENYGERNKHVEKTVILTNKVDANGTIIRFGGVRKIVRTVTKYPLWLNNDVMYVVVDGGGSLKGGKEIK